MSSQQNIWGRVQRDFWVGLAFVVLFLILPAFEPGKYIGIWWEMIGTNQSTWGSGAHHGAKTQKVKDYIDFGSKYGFKGVLVEGWNTGWDVNWCCSGDGEAFDFYHSHPDFDSKEVKEYARKKNIRIKLGSI